jgi:flagellin-specific chaperone FliS
MRDRDLGLTWRSVAAGLVTLVIITGPAWGQQGSSTSASQHPSNDAQPVVRTFGAESGYHTEVTSRPLRTLSEEDQRQVSLLTAQVFEHIEKARNAIDADDAKEALKEVNKGLEGVKAIRAMLPKATVRTRTTAPDGKVIYEDECEVQEHRIPLYEGMLHKQTLAPILAARRNALQIAGVHVVESETIATEVIADLDRIEGQLSRAAKALEHNRVDEANNALALALVRGLDFRFSKEDTALASARDAIWLARRSLEENNATQALANLAVARQRLQVYREVLSPEHRQEVDQMLSEVEQLESQLRQEGSQPASSTERTRQGNIVTQWWDRINSWFRRHL